MSNSLQLNLKQDLNLKSASILDTRPKTRQAKMIRHLLQNRKRHEENFEKVNNSLTNINILKADNTNQTNENNFTKQDSFTQIAAGSPELDIQAN